MNVLFLLLLFLGFVCFIMAALKPEVIQLNLLALGLACWVLVPFLQQLERV